MAFDAFLEEVVSMSSETHVPEVVHVIPPGIRKSQEAFWRDLPELLPMRSRKREWVAYHGDERIGFGRTRTELCQECLRRGINDDEYYVGRIEPHWHAPWEEIDIDP